MRLAFRTLYRVPLINRLRAFGRLIQHDCRVACTRKCIATQVWNVEKRHSEAL